MEQRGRGNKGDLLGTGEAGQPGQPFPFAFQLLHLTRRLLGQRLFEKLMKMTFYGQFVAGEDQESIRPLIRHNRAFGVGSILDYGVEEDLSPEEAERKEME